MDTQCSQKVPEPDIKQKWKFFEVQAFSLLFLKPGRALNALDKGSRPDSWEVEWYHEYSFAFTEPHPLSFWKENIMCFHRFLWWEPEHSQTFDYQITDEYQGKKRKILNCCINVMCSSKACYQLHFHCWSCVLLVLLLLHIQFLLYYFIYGGCTNNKTKECISWKDNNFLVNWKNIIL